MTQAIVNGELVTLSDEEEKKLQEEVNKYSEQKKKTKYKIQRQMAYPSYADQFDTIYHQGLDAWKAEIKAVKDKYPKPE